MNQLLYEGKSLTSCDQRVIPWRGPFIYQYEYIALMNAYMNIGVGYIQDKKKC